MKKGLLVYVIVFFIFLYLPVLLLPVFSFNDSPIVAFPLKGFTTAWYSGLAEMDVLHRALGNSLKVGVFAAFLSTALAIPAARAFSLYRFHGRRLSEVLTMAPLVLPQIIVGISLLIVLKQLGFNLSLLTVALGHTLLCLPFAVSILKSGFDGFDISLEEASLDLGESAFRTFFRVTLPVILPGIVSSMLITFTISFDEFIVAFFLAGTEPTVPVYIWSQLRFPARIPNILALGSILLMFSILMLAVGEMIRRRASRGKPLSGDFN